MYTNYVIFQYDFPGYSFTIFLNSAFYTMNIKYIL